MNDSFLLFYHAYNKKGKDDYVKCEKTFAHTKRERM